MRGERSSNESYGSIPKMIFKKIVRYANDICIYYVYMYTYVSGERVERERMANNPNRGDAHIRGSRFGSEKTKGQKIHDY